MLKHKNSIIIMSVVFVLFSAVRTVTAQQEIPDGIKDQILQGITALDSAKAPGDIDKAVDIFQKIVTTNPGYADVHYYLGKTYSMMQGNTGRAVKELKKYLELYPDAPDKEKVTQEIAKSEEAIKMKRKFNLSGIELMSLSDGVYVRSIYPGCPYDRITFRGGGVKPGDKVVKIGSVDVSGMTLQGVLNTIEADTSAKHLRVTVIRGGSELSLPMMKMPKVVAENVRELGEDDLYQIIKETKVPLVIGFWTDWCEPCKKYLTLLTGLVYKYKDTLSVVTVSVDENKTLVREFNLSDPPVVLLYNNGEKVGEIKGIQEDELKAKVEAMYTPSKE